MSTTTIKVATSEDELQGVYRFRYDVYVSEMGRRSFYTDHEAGILRHPLDDTAVNIAAYDKDLNVIGVIRNNLGADGDFGYFREFYDVAAVGADHPAATVITSGLMVASVRRGGPLATRLAVASYEYCIRRGVRWAFMDCIPPLAGFFYRQGWIEHLPEAKYPEYPITVRRMRLDVEDEDHFESVRSPFLKALRDHRRRRNLAGPALFPEQGVSHEFT